MRWNRPVLVLCAIYALALAALDVAQTAHFRSEAESTIGHFDARIAELRPAIARAGVQRVGFVAFPAAERDDDDAFFFLAQYALAPVVVEATTKRAWVVAVSQRPGALEEFAATHGFHVVARVEELAALLAARGRL